MSERDHLPRDPQVTRITCMCGYGALIEWKAPPSHHGVILAHGAFLRAPDFEDVAEFRCPMIGRTVRRV